MTEKKDARFILSVEFDNLGSVIATCDTLVGFGGDREGALAEGQKVVTWLRAHADEFERQMHEQYPDPKGQG